MFEGRGFNYSGLESILYPEGGFTKTYADISVLNELGFNSARFLAQSCVERVPNTCQPSRNPSTGCHANAPPADLHLQSALESLLG